MPLFPFGWHQKEANAADSTTKPVVQPAVPTPYDPTHVWVSTPSGDVLTNTVTGQVVPGPAVTVKPVSVVSAGTSYSAVTTVTLPPTPKIAIAVLPAPKETPKMSLISTLEADGKKILSVMEAVAAEVTKVLPAVEKYLPEASALASVIFPQFAPQIAAGVTTFTGIANLIQSAVVSVEQKASALPAGLTGLQKSAEVLQIVSATVISELATLKITAGATYVQSLVNAIVAILNVPSVTA